MKLHVLLLAAVLPLAGCASLTNTFDAVTGATVSPKVALVAVNGFDALEVVATGYRQLPSCATPTSPACYNPTIWLSIKKAVLVGRTARTQVETALAANPAGIPIATYNTLQSAISVLQTYYVQYNIQTAAK